VSVDAQQLEGSAVCGYGLLLRDNPAGVYQFGLAHRDQQFSVFAWNEAKGASRMLVGRLNLKRFIRRSQQAVGDR